MYVFSELPPEEFNHNKRRGERRRRREGGREEGRKERGLVLKVHYVSFSHICYIRERERERVFKSAVYNFHMISTALSVSSLQLERQRGGRGRE